MFKMQVNNLNQLNDFFLTFQPEDWDDEMDGEWEPPMIDNPEYKGEWKPRQIDNPAYKGTKLNRIFNMSACLCLVQTKHRICVTTSGQPTFR